MHDEEFHNYHSQANASTSVERLPTRSIAASADQLRLTNACGTRLSSTIADKHFHVLSSPPQSCHGGISVQDSLRLLFIEELVELSRE